MQDRRSRRSRRARFAGCGGTARPHTGHQSAGNPGPFAWLRPSAAPADWKIARLPSRKAQLAYPPRWRAIRTDPGTFFRGAAGMARPHPRLPQRNAPVRRRDTRQLGQLSPCPQPRRGRRDVVRDASAVGLRFRSGTGACVIDHCASTSARYKEIACIVRGTRATTVVVAAARPADRTRLAPQLQRAVASFSS